MERCCLVGIEFVQMLLAHRLVVGAAERCRKSGNGVVEHRCMSVRLTGDFLEKNVLGGWR